jgi:hypothetical protein
MAGHTAVVDISDARLVQGSCAELREQMSRLKQLFAAPQPSTFAEAIPQLEQLAATLACLQQRLRGPLTAGTQRELLEIKADMQSLTALIQQAAAFYLGWSTILATAAKGYTAQGAAAPLEAGPRLSVEA